MIMQEVDGELARYEGGYGRNVHIRHLFAHHLDGWRSTSGHWEYRFEWVGEECFYVKCLLVRLERRGRAPGEGAREADNQHPADGVLACVSVLLA